MDFVHGKRRQKDKTLREKRLKKGISWLSNNSIIKTKPFVGEQTLAIPAPNIEAKVFRYTISELLVLLVTAFFVL
jgi:hypothetical protein